MVAHVDAQGTPLSIGRKTRTILAVIKRALLLRDWTCRFPGCTHSRYVDGHHIEHWANGGETALSNLMLLCRAHHTLLHEGGCRVEANGANGWNFFDHRNQIIDAQPAPHPTLTSDVASQRYTTPMPRSPLRLAPTHQNGPAKRSTMRGASTIWCEARQGESRRLVVERGTGNGPRKSTYLLITCTASPRAAAAASIIASLSVGCG
ncbi:MAG: HNH endonuclease [Kofleriaceae bacterium]|nr:HNH endonuclease [Kofleriaceae bacterium]